MPDSPVFINPGDYDMEAFRNFERTGWEGLADSYRDVTWDSTRLAAAHLLDAVGVVSGMQLLDVATGPGYCAGLGAERGAESVGVDFAASMVEAASRNYPRAIFRKADAEALPFPAAIFDAVVCAFGVLHFANPDAAVAEAYRVLVRGGRYAFTSWSTPDRVPHFGMLKRAIEAHGTMDVPTPPGPPMFRFSDHDACREVLEQAGFKKVEVREITVLRRTTPKDLLAGLSKATVRSRALMAGQTPAARAAIDAQILAEAQAMARQGIITMELPAVLAVGRKP